MILTITLILTALVVLNFLLLIFSCNKTSKRIPEVKKTTIISKQLTKQSASVQLAPTGS
jgi:hypothetical protein